MNTLHCATPPSKSTGPITGPRNRRAQRRRGMAAWVLGWGLIMLAPLWALSAYLAWEVHTTRKDSIHRELAQRSETAAHAVHERIETGIGLLQSLAVSDAALTNDLPALYRHAQRAAKQMPGVTGVGLLDQDRRMVFSPHGPMARCFPHHPTPKCQKAYSPMVFPRYRAISWARYPGSLWWHWAYRYIRIGGWCIASFWY